MDQMTDQQAAAAYVRSDECCVMDDYSAHEQTFLAGIAHRDAEVKALVEALRTIKSDGNLNMDAFESNESRKEIAAKALSRFEAAQGKGKL